MDNEPKIGSTSPWDTVQTVRTITPGIIAVSTAGHGGYWLSQARYHAMPAALRCNVYGGGTWFEEDCEWALVAMAFPEVFTDEEIFFAVASFKGEVDPGSTYLAAAHWLKATPAGQAISRRAAAIGAARATPAIVKYFSDHQAAAA
jgi:hypothetical protein